MLFVRSLTRQAPFTIIFYLPDLYDIALFDMNKLFRYNPLDMAIAYEVSAIPFYKEVKENDVRLVCCRLKTAGNQTRVGMELSFSH